MRPDARPELPGLLHLGPRHRPHLRAQHRQRRPAAADPARRPGRPLEHRRARWPARRATRSSTCATASSLSFGWELPRLEDKRRASCATSSAAGSSTGSSRSRRGSRSPSTTPVDVAADGAAQPAQPDLRPERRRAAHRGAVVRHRLLPAPDPGRQRGPDRRRGPQHRARARLHAHRPVALQELRHRARATRCSSGSRPSTSSTRRASASRAARLGAPTFGVVTAAEEGRIVQLGVKYIF